VKRETRPVVVAAAVGSLAAIARHVWRRPLPKTKGPEQVPGLERPVEVIRDRWGVPHIYAQSARDLFFSQGYVHAQDRLWQMEFNRRVGHGRLSEIGGEAGFEADRLVRTLGFTRDSRRDLAQYDADTLAVLQAYADGVNAWIAGHRNRLPLEFTLLGLHPAPWEPLDSMVYGRVVGWVLSHNWEEEVLRTALIAQVGPERAAQLQCQYPPQYPLILPDQTYVSLANQVLEEFQKARVWLPALRYQGLSNNWVVDGSRTISGMPMLANDPHLGLDMPSIWYENHLSSPDVEVSGVSFAGVPGVVIGHNEHIGWGITASIPDTQDLYLERFHPDDPTLYQVGDGWERATVYQEEVKVRGERTPRMVQVIETRHGPVISNLIPLEGESQKVALALRWVGKEPSNLARSIRLVNIARNWDEFCQALRDFDCPSQNLVYADRDGNIGLYVPGRIPVRQGYQGLVPVPGWDGEHEWQGWIPHEELPHASNPRQGYFVTANNKVAGLEYPRTFSLEQYDGQRARRITDLLLEKDKLSAEDFGRIQNDVYSLSAAELVPLLTDTSQSLPDHPALREQGEQASEVLASLQRWDRRLTADSVEATVYELTEHFAAQRLFRPWLGDLTDRYLGLKLAPMFHYNSHQVNNSRRVLRQMLLENRTDWFRDQQGQPVSREDILASALADALGYLRANHGPDMSGWRWGNLHRITFHHAMGQARTLGHIFDRGPYPLGGDGNTVNAAFYKPELPINDYSAGPSWRMILDLSDWDASLGVLPTGQSGHPASRHYDDQIALWREGRYHPMPWSRQRVLSLAEGRLVLIP